MIKHLCRRSKSKPFAGAVIQPVLDHFNFLNPDVLHLALLPFWRRLKSDPRGSVFVRRQPVLETQGGVILGGLYWKSGCKGVCSATGPAS